jgi:hypothetical protein
MTTPVGVFHPSPIARKDVLNPPPFLVVPADGVTPMDRRIHAGFPGKKRILRLPTNNHFSMIRYSPFYGSRRTQSFFN